VIADLAGERRFPWIRGCLLHATLRRVPEI
jgi:hypothetical protein